MRGKRWWYWAPRSLTHPYALKIYTSADEFCNPTLYVGLPLLGALIVRYRPGPLRTRGCAKCEAEFGPWCDGCQSFHTGPRCHPRLWECGHSLEAFEEGLVAWQRCPLCVGDYCDGCEPDPTKTCPKGAAATMPLEIDKRGEVMPAESMAEGEMIYCKKCGWRRSGDPHNCT